MAGIDRIAWSDIDRGQLSATVEDTAADIRDVCWDGNAAEGATSREG